MFHVVRAWRTSRTIRLLILIILLGTAAQLVMSQQQQSKRIGNDRLVSVHPLPPDADGEMCEMVPLPATHEEVLMAALQQREDFRQAVLAARSAAAATDFSNME